MVLQEPLAGPLVMVQAIFDSGRLVAWHANLREREGAGGGSCSKLSFSHPALARDLARLGEELDWHGALCLDAILTPDGPSYIDVNPRLVEPGNAWRAGVDLVGALLRVSLGSTAPVAAPAAARGTHAPAAPGGARRGAARRRPPRRGARVGERPRCDAVRTRGAPRSSRRCAAIRWRWCPCWLPRSPRSRARARTGFFTGGAVESYALTPEAWRRSRRTRSAADSTVPAGG